jgi:hypothetical protein
MPTISRFYGITIRMYFLAAEHNPPHIHVIYGEDAAEIEIKTGEIIYGSLPAKAQSLVYEWVSLHRDELVEMWETQEFRSIPPLM